VITPPGKFEGPTIKINLLGVFVSKFKAVEGVSSAARVSMGVRLQSVVDSNSATCVFYNINPNYTGIRFFKSKSMCTRRESEANSIHYRLLIHCEIVMSYCSGTVSIQVSHVQSNLVANCYMHTSKLP
jgi:hypothetical protein